jgi:hypothetical protein
MNIETAFDKLQAEVNVDPDDLKRARERRDVFRSGLRGEPDVVKVIPSGSLARGSHADPIHDVDLIIEYGLDQHRDWGADGPSAEDALQYLGSQVNRLLGATNGTFDQVVRLASPRNHAVKCFLDDPEDPDAFTVDAMPALRLASGALLVPEAKSTSWITTDPEYLIRLVAERHADWNQFVKLVRVLKRWNRDNGCVMKSLLVEVLALECLTTAGTRGLALAQYFTSANVRLGLPVEDPAGLCGPIQSDLNVSLARALLSGAATTAHEAIDAERRKDADAALGHWQGLFGEIFPTGHGSASAVATAAAGAAVVNAAPRQGPRRVRNAPQG